MSAEYYGDVPSLPLESLSTDRDLTLARQQASDARQHAAASGDYAAAERWYAQERALEGQLARRDQRERVGVRA